jgi:hypothetical protein
MSGLSGQDLDVMFGDLRVHFESISLNIEDGSVAVHTGGVPNGFVGGKFSASGDIELDTANFNLIIDAAKSAGSFSKLPVFDAVFNAEGDDSLNIEAFGCKFKLQDLLNASGEGGEKLKHKIGYEVTSKDFVNINGVPYIDPERTKDLL